jgi:S-ribosylhomocysteine lyase
MNKIASFSVNHDYIVPGIYISRIDGDITTYDLRTRTPNAGSYMDNLTMHSVEHMFATFIRNSVLGENILYFGPMGCQTGFYLLVRHANDGQVLEIVKDVLHQILNYEGAVFGASRQECGNYQNLSLQAAQQECATYLENLNRQKKPFLYPTHKEN